MRQSEFNAALGITMLIGAARQDANQVQLGQLRTLLEPDSVFRRLILDGEWRAARDLVHKIMGPDWRPAEEWRQYGA